MPTARHGTLVASTVTTVTLPSNVTQLEVLNRSGSAEIYFTVDGSTSPTVGGNDCYVLPASIGATIVSSQDTANTVVRLISSGTPTYSVTELL